MLSKQLSSSNLKVDVSTMEEYDYGHKKYDFIIAMFALSFIAPCKFEDTFLKITSSLKSDGVFAFHLFGINDGYSKNNKMTFYDKKSISTILKDMHFLKLEEIEYD